MIVTRALLCAADPTHISIVDAMVARGRGGGPPDAPSTFWTPNIIQTRNSTLLLAMSEPTYTNYMVSSQDQGKSWTRLAQPMGPPGTSQLVYSHTTNTVILLGKSPNMVDNGTRVGNASFLYMSKSVDDGVHWSEPVPINQTNSAYGTHYGGSGRTPGIELARGPYRGRIVVPKIGKKLSDKTGEVHSFAMYSDDQGKSWTIGEELPDQWDECTLTELKNGSVLLSPRIDDPENTDRHHPDPNMTRVHTTRAFARSDDGGATWAQVWTLYERQPDMYDSPCSDALVYSEKTGATYFGHPHGINGTRTNYTILRSLNQGASWSILEVVYKGGAGYSSMALLPSSGDGDLLAIAFQRTIWDPNLEGGGYNIAVATVPVQPTNISLVS